MLTRKLSTDSTLTPVEENRCCRLVRHVVFVFCCALVWEGLSDGKLLAQTVVGAGFAAEGVRVGDEFRYGFALFVNDRENALSRGLFVAQYRSSREGLDTIRARMSRAGIVLGSGGFQANAFGEADVTFVNGAVERRVPTIVTVTSSTTEVILLFADRFLVSDADIVFGGNDFHDGFRPGALIVGGVNGASNDLSFAAAPGTIDKESVGRIAAVLLDGEQTFVDGQLNYAEFMVRGGSLLEVQLTGVAMVTNHSGDTCIGELAYAATFADGTAESLLAVPSCGVVSDESYDAVDFQNMFLAKVPPNPAQ